MKTLIITGLLTFLFCSVRAEYNGYHLSLEITTKSGEVIEGYTYITIYNIDEDSMNHTPHIIRRIQHGLGNYNHSRQIKYATERIKYEFVPAWANNDEKDFIYCLSHLDSIKLSDIKSIKINDITDYTYMVGIWNVLDSHDLEWIQKTPIKSYAFSGYLCSYQVFVHEISEHNKTILKKLDALQVKIDKYYKRMSTGELMEEERQDEDDFDEQVADLMSQLKLAKVVVISECTC